MPNSPVVPPGMPLPDADEADGNATVAARRDPLLTPPKVEKAAPRNDAEVLLAKVAERQAAIEDEIKTHQKARAEANEAINALREEAKLNTRLLNASKGRKRS